MIDKSFVVDKSMGIVTDTMIYMTVIMGVAYVFSFDNPKSWHNPAIVFVALGAGFALTFITRFMHWSADQLPNARKKQQLDEQEPVVDSVWSKPIDPVLTFILFVAMVAVLLIMVFGSAIVGGVT